MFVVNTEHIAGHRIDQVLGLVFGVAVRNRSLQGKWLGRLLASMGGRQGKHEEVSVEIRGSALDAMIEHARSLGANAIVMARFESGEFGAGSKGRFNEVAVYGTAVVASALIERTD